MLQTRDMFTKRDGGRTDQVEWSISRSAGRLVLRHFGTIPELSGHFETMLMVPKYLGTEVSWSRSVLLPVGVVS